MPRRKLITPTLPPPVDDALEDVRNILRAADPDRVAYWYDRASPAERHLIDRILAEDAALGWRANPATMMCHLDPTKKLWRYVQLLGQLFADGFYRREPRQDVEIPSQYGKTTIYGKWGPIWALDMNPRLRIMYVSYDADKAVEECGQARDLVEEHAHELRFTLRPDKRARGFWKTEQGGWLYATGVGGAITGFPADGVIGDDLLKGWQAAHSEADRERTWKVVISQMRMRLQRADDPFMLVGTRWHEDDPQGRALTLLDGVDKFRRIRLPAVAEAPSEKFPEGDPLGRAPGEVLEPERFPPHEVHARAKMLGSYLAAAMEQQNPAPEEGTDIKRAWFKLDDMVTPLRSINGTAADSWATSWDMKLKDKEAGDFVVGGVWARIGGDFWLVDVLRGQWNQATAKAAIVLMLVRYPWVKTSYVENAGNAPETMDELRKRDDDYQLSSDVQGALGATDDEARAVERIIRRGVTGLIPVPPQGDKRVRARAVSPVIEAGNVHLPARALWVETFLAEVAAFPNGAYDDQVDMMSQALSKMSHMEATTGVATTSIPRPAARAVGSSPSIRMPWQR